MSELTRDEIIECAINCAECNAYCQGCAIADINGCEKTTSPAVRSLRDDYNAEVEKNKRLTAELAKVTAELKQVTAERDAAINDINKIQPCKICKNLDQIKHICRYSGTCHSLKPTTNMTFFKWRGLTEQEDKP